MNYNRLLARFVEKQRLVGVEAILCHRWANVGRIDICRPGMLSPFMVVAFHFDDQFSTLAYFKPGPRCDYNTGSGCMCPGAIRQETFQAHQADEAFSNLMCYANLALNNDWAGLPTKGVYLGWTAEMERDHAAPCC